MKKRAPKTSQSNSGLPLAKPTGSVLKTASDIVSGELQDIQEGVADLEHQAAKELKQLKQVVGPGVITGAADDDPSGIAVYSSGGAQFGLRINWLVLFMLPMMIAVQDMAGRIGLVTGKGFAGVIKQHYSKKLLLLAVSLLLVANIVNIGADLGAMAAATQLVVGGSVELWAILWTALIALLVIFVGYHSYARILKFLTLSLLAYVATVFVVRVDWSAVFTSLITPHFEWSKAYIATIVGFLGTTISPYLFFWQASEEVEEKESRQAAKHATSSLLATKKEIRQQRIDTVGGMFFSQIVTFFIVVTSAVTLHQAGITTISTAQDAAAALRPLAGNFASLLFSIGIIGTGLLGVPVLAGSGAYAIAEGMDWKEGLNLKFRQARGFYTVIILSLLTGLAMILLGVDPIKGLFYAAIVNGLVAPLLVAILTNIAGNKEIMGNRTNSKITIAIGWITAAVMTVAAIALLVTL